MHGEAIISTGLTASPAYLGHLLSDIAVIPAQKSRDLIYRQAMHEHVAQLKHFLIRPFLGDVRARRLGISVGALRIEDQGADPSQERVLFGISWPVEERPDFYICHLTA